LLQTNASPGSIEIEPGLFVFTDGFRGRANLVAVWLDLSEVLRVPVPVVTLELTLRSLRVSHTVFLIAAALYV
jgi:hypothetical protein